MAADATLIDEQRLEAILTRAGDHLRADQVESAEREVAAALAIAPADLRARNLLGMVRFRAGRFDEAERVYQELVARSGDDPAVRLNLGLVELRLGKHAEAALELRRVVEREPHNLKAHGYLGMALMRAGDLPAAREAFVLAGQQDLIAQVDVQLAAAVQRPAGVPASLLSGPSGERSGRTILRMEPDGDPSLLAGPRAREGAAGKGATSASSLARFLEQHDLRTAPGEAYAISSEGLLVVRVEGRLATRTQGAVASSGRLAYAPIYKRTRGRTGDEPFGDGEDALVTASGTGTVVVSPRGLKFTAVRLAETTDVLYLREAAVFSFEETLLWENGRIPGGGESRLEVVQFRGQGRLVLRSKQTPTAVQVGAGDVLYVEQTALLGWAGNVVPQQLRGLDGAPTQFIACGGEGAILLDELVTT